MMTSSTYTILLIVSIVLLVLVVLVVFFVIRSAAKKPVDLDLHAEQAPPPPPALELESPERTEPSRFAAMELAKSFRHALKILRARDGDRESRYLQPWYLLLGPSGSGKTSLFSQSDLASEMLEQVQIEQGAEVTWNCFENGVVLDIAGDWSFDNTARTASIWRRLLHLISRYRPAHALDGIIVAFPATDFVGDKALSQTEIVERAMFVQQRLRQIQVQTGFHLPVYFILTQCDHIEGFSAFCGALEPEERRGMFGWSNPFSTEVQFHSEWTDLAFTSIRLAVENRVSRLFAVEDYTRAHDALFLLPGNLLGMQERLKTFLARMLRSSSEIESPIFRGLFLTGSREDMRVPFSLDMSDMVPASMPRAEASYEWGSLALGKPREATTRFHQATEPVSFVRDLFLRKIFGERSLAVPLSQSFYARDRARRILQIVSIVLAAILIAGGIYGYLQMGHKIDRLQPLMTSIADDMDGQNALPASQGEFDGPVHTPTDDLLRAMLELRNNGIHSVFYPWSWGYSLDHDIDRAMIPSLRVLILKRFERQLEKRAALVTAAQQWPSQDGESLNPAEQSLSSPLTNEAVELLPAYQQQRAFVDGILALQHHIDQYERLRTPGNPDSLASVAELDGYLNARPPVILPSDASSPIFDKALSETLWQPFRYSERDERNAAMKLQELSSSLFTAVIEQNRLRRATDALVVALGRINGPRPAYEDIRAAQQAYATLNSALSDPQLAWIGGSDFKLPIKLASVTTMPLGKSTYLPESLRPETEAAAQESYQHLLSALLSAHSSLSGSLLEIRDGKLQLTPKAQEVQLGLDNLLNLSFMSPISDARGMGIAPGSNLGSPAVFSSRGIQQLGGNITWSKPALEAAAAMPNGLQQYLSEDLDQAPPALQESLGRIARDRIGVVMEAAVANAEQPGPRLPPEPQFDADIQPAVQRFADVAPTLRKVMDSMRSAGLSGPFSRLRSVTSEQARLLLDEVNRTFYDSAPYTVSDVAVDHWDGKTEPSEAFFGAAGETELTGYLAGQRERVRAYNAAAEPLIAFLAANGDTGSQVYRRWRSIGIALRQYDSKQSDSSVKLLEGYLSGDFEKARITNGCSAGRSPFPRSSSDYFVDVYLNLRTELTARCAVLSGLEQASAYTVLAERFNRELAGRFPFAPLTASSLIEADPQEIAGVYKLYQDNVPFLASTTNAAQNNFLSNLAAAQPFFNALTSNPKASIDFLPHFRADREHEVGGNQIADWTLQVGSDTFRASEPERKGTWSVGEPITLTLRWASDAPFVPSSSTSGSMHATPTSVTFRFNDSWALLRFMATYSASSRDPDPAHLDSGLLLFRIPETGAPNLAKLQHSSIAEASVFLRLTLLMPGKPDVVAAPPLPLLSEAPLPDHVLARQSRQHATRGMTQ